MCRRLVAVLVLVLAAAVTAAPVPKSIKKRLASPDGTWLWTEFHSNGVKQNKQGDSTTWTLEGETFRIGASTWSLTIPDPDKPNSRRFTPPGGGTGYSAMVEVDGDELRFCYSGNQNETVTECKPTPNVYYYLFKRAADNGK